MEVHTRPEAQPLPAISHVSWGALFAGLAFIIGGTWLMFLLGSAIGMSVADGTDLAAFGDGLSISAIVWILLSSLLVYFLAAMLTGRLTGHPDEKVGALHGVTLWGLGTALTLVMGALGVSGLLGAGATAVSGISNSAGAVAQMAKDAGLSAGATIEDLIDSEIGTDIQQRLKQEASQAIAQTQDGQGPRASAAELREAAEAVDADLLQRVGSQVAQGDVEAAQEQLAEETDLSEEEIGSLIEGLERQAERLSETQFVQDLERAINEQAQQATGAVSRMAGSDVSRAELREALEELDAETLAATGRALISGDEEGAKAALAANTTLSQSQIDSIISGVGSEVRDEIEQVRDEVEQAVEAASTYATAALWAAFVAAALGLLAAILGGIMGTTAAQRLAVRHAR